MKRLLLVLFLFSALPVNAMSFGNGDFSNGGDLWHDASSAGSVSFVAEQAVLETGAGVHPFSAIMVQGDDGSFWSPQAVDPFTLAVDAKWLLFDAMFEDLGPDNSETGNGFFTDALFIALYDYLDPGQDLFLDPFIDSSLDGAGFNSFALNVASLQGREIALYFELSDEDDGLNSKVTLDNVQFVASLPGTVPAPSVLVLLLAGLPFARLFYKKSRV